MDTINTSIKSFLDKQFTTSSILTIYSNKINSPTNYFMDNSFKSEKFSTNLNEVSVSANSFMDKTFKNTIISTILNDVIIESEINTSIRNTIFKSTVLYENSSKIITENIQSKNTQLNNNQKIYYVIEGNNEEIYQEVLDNFLLDFDFDKQEELIFQGEDDFFFHLTNTQNEIEALKGNNNISNKFSIIDLGECENLLKNHYKINKNVSLLILKFEKISNITTERLLQYEVYEPNNKTKLNLSICDTITIDIYIPIVLSEKIQNLYNELQNLGYDLFDINSPFYNDICTPYKSPDGTDVPLSDRVNYLYNNEETTCQSNCKFSEFLKESQYLKCDCDITNSEISTQKTKEFSAKTIYESFFDVLKYSNYKVLKCFKLTFRIKNFIHNIGCILAIIYFLIYLVFLIIYYIKGINQVKIALKKYLEKDKNKIDSDKTEKEFEKIGIKINKDNKKYNIIEENIFKINKNINNNIFINDLKIKNKKHNNRIIRKTKCRKKHYQKIIFTNPPKKVFYSSKQLDIKKQNKINISENKYVNNILVTNKSTSLKFSRKTNENKEDYEINKQILDIIKFNEKEREQLDYYELNNLEYDSAK